MGAAFAALGAALTFVVNLGIAIWALNSRDVELGNTVIGNLFHGDCKQAYQLNTWSHLAINVISTLLVAGSNYCMQCLTAPTRTDVDQAHSQMKWLDIGVPSSWRNIAAIDATRRILWVLLVLSSLPLHLMFNSAFFTSLVTNDYNVVFATEGFVAGEPFSPVSNDSSELFPLSHRYNEHLDGTLPAVQRSVQDGAYQRLEPQDCIAAYANDLNTNRRTLVVISNNASDHGGGSFLGGTFRQYDVLISGEDYDPYQWMCSERDLIPLGYDPSSFDEPTCLERVKRLQQEPAIWTPSGFNVEYCLSEQVPEQCGFYINFVIVGIVLACNAAKIIIMSFVAFSKVIDQPLRTVGDAVESFVLAPDTSTQAMCIVTRQYMKRTARRKPAANKSCEDCYVDEPMMARQQQTDELYDTWHPKELQVWQVPSIQRWYRAVSRTRWIFTGLLFAACYTTTIGLLDRALKSLRGQQFFGRDRQHRTW